MIHPSPAATEVLLESHVRCRASAASVRSVYCKRVSFRARQVWDLWEHTFTNRSFLGGAVLRQKSEKWVAATPAWRRPGPLPPAVHGEPQRPLRPGQGRERAAVRMPGWDSGLASRLAKFVRPRARA